MPDEPRAITWRDFDRLEKKVDGLDERIDRFIVIVLGVFGTLTVFGLGTAVTLLTTTAG